MTKRTEKLRDYLSGKVLPYQTYSSSPPQNAVKAKPVDIAPGPSAEEVNAAEQRAEQMQQETQAIDSSRKAAQPSNAGSTGSPDVVTTSETSGNTYYNNDRRPNPLTRVPIESSSGGDHKIYSPNKGIGGPPSAQPHPISRPQPARR